MHEEDMSRARESTMMKQPVEKLARELVEFAKKNAPETLFSSYSYLDYHVSDAFWEEKGVRFGSAGFRLHRSRVEKIAEMMMKEERKSEISKLLRGKNEKELISEMAAYAQKAYPRSEFSDHAYQETLRSFWLEKYPEIASDWALVYFRQIVERAVGYAEVKKRLLEWMEKSAVGRLRKADVERFLRENGIQMKWEERQSLFHEATQTHA